MLTIGLTGSLATGKSTVASMFEKLGAKVVNADQIAYSATRPGGKCFRPIIKTFGAAIVKGGFIDRKALGKIVFKNRAKLKKLESIIHPVVRQEALKKIKQYKKGGKTAVVILDVPLLFEAGVNRLTQFDIVVKAPQKKQIQRATRKLKISSRDVLKRIRNQMPLKNKIFLADFVIDNGKTLSETQKQVENIWTLLQQKKKR